MTFGEFIILLALAAAVGLAVRSLWRGRGSCGRWLRGVWYAAAVMAIAAGAAAAINRAGRARLPDSAGGRARSLIFQLYQQRRDSAACGRGAC